MTHRRVFSARKLIHGLEMMEGAAASSNDCVEVMTLTAEKRLSFRWCRLGRQPGKAGGAARSGATWGKQQLLTGGRRENEGIKNVYTCTALPC